MRVENHTERLIKIPIMSVSAENKSVGEVDKIILLPGVNDVDPNKWDKVKGIALIGALLEKGQRRGGLVVGDPKESLKSLAGMKESAAVETIEECIDVALLKGWQATEKREGVLVAIAKQFEKMDPKAK